MATTATTTATAKETKLTAAQRVAATISKFQKVGIENLTGYELQQYSNALLKQEQKSLRYVYATLKRAYEGGNSEFELTIKTLAGSKFPTFAAFKKAYKSKYVSNWGGMATLKALNPKLQLKAKVKRQNKATAKK